MENINSIELSRLAPQIPHARPRWMPSLSTARAAVLDRLADQPEPCRAASLATLLRLHQNTVREHLDGLVAVGLATRRPADPDGRGRPAWLYAARHRAADRSSRPEGRAHAALAAALVAHLVKTSDTVLADAEQAGAAWGHQVAASNTYPVEAPSNAPPGQRSAVAARRQVVNIMDDLGFAPDADGRATDVRLRQCPLLESAHQHLDVVCTVHLGLVRGALAELGADPERTSLEPFSEPGACRLRLMTPRVVRSKGFEPPTF